VADLIVMDEHFGPNLMLGTTAIPKLRAALSGSEVIISCTGNATESALNGVDVDAIWSKPVPDWHAASDSMPLDSSPASVDSFAACAGVTAQCKEI
jgi:hypothetical protein